MWTQNLLGIVAALGSAASWAVGAILFKRLGESLSPLAMTLAKSALSIVLLGVVLIAVGYQPLDGTTVLLLGISGLLGIALADSLFFGALQDLGARDMVLLLTVGQVFTVLLAVAFLHERPGPVQWVGMALVLGGITSVLLANVPRERQRSHRRGLVLGLLSALCMAASQIIAKKGLDETSALQATVIRMAFGGAGLLVFGLITRQLGHWTMPFANARLATVFFAAVCVITFGGFWMSLAAIKYGQVSVNSVLIGTEPLFALPLAAIFLKERITLPAMAGTVLAVAGVALLCVVPTG